MTTAAPFYTGADGVREVLNMPQHPGYTVPDRSLAQRLEALEKANSVRTQRAQLKRDIKAGRKTVYGHLLAPPDFIKTMKVWDLLLAAPKVGRVKVNKMLVQARISPSKTVEGLSERQRNELANWVKHY